MARVWVRVEDAGAGRLPPLCARRGERCISRYRRDVRRVPGLLEWLTWSELWPLGRLLGPAHRVVLPLLPDVRDRARKLGALRDLTAAATVALFSVAILLPRVVAGAWPSVVGGWLARGGRWVLLAHLLVAVLGIALTVGTRVDRTGRWVELSRVSRTFARHTEQRLPRPDEPPRTAWQERLGALRPDATVHDRRAVSRTPGQAEA